MECYLAVRYCLPEHFVLEMKLKLQTFLDNSFLRNTLVLTSGTALAQILPMAIYPALGRLYDPIDFAVLASLTSFVSILNSFFSGKYENAIFLAKDDKEAASLFSLSLILTLAFSFISFILLHLFKGGFENYLGLSKLPYWILISLLSASFINVFNSYNEWCVRKEYFKRLSANKVANSLGISLGKLGFGFTPFTNVGLVIGDLIGRLLSAILCISRLLYFDISKFKGVKFKDVTEVAIKYIEFPKFNMPAQLLNTIGVAFPVFILNNYYQPNQVGLYAMTMSILNLPINVVSLSIRDVFRKKANDIYIRQQEYSHFFKKSLSLLSIFSVVSGIILVPFLPGIFGVVLGDKWIESGVYAQYLSPMIVLDFIAISLSGSLLVSKKLKSNFFWQVYYVLLSVLPLIIGGYVGFSIEKTLFLFSFCRCTSYIYLILISYKASKK